jgi:hypothetical protein
LLKFSSAKNSSISDYPCWLRLANKRSRIPTGLKRFSASWRTSEARRWRSKLNLRSNVQVHQRQTIYCFLTSTNVCWKEAITLCWYPERSPQYLHTAKTNLRDRTTVTYTLFSRS